MEQIQAISFNIDYIGKHVKGSKKRFTWELSLKGRMHSISLDFSFISGKVKIIVDRKILLENYLPDNVSFQYPFTLDGYALNVIQQGDTFELRVNNKVFSHLYTQQKTNSYFRKYEDEVHDIKVDNAKLKDSKKITLNLGAGMKKKTKADDQPWNAFGGANDFPSFFEGAPAPAKITPKPEAFNLLDVDHSQEKQQYQSFFEYVPKPKPSAESSLLFESKPVQSNIGFNKNSSVQYNLLDISSKPKDDFSKLTSAFYNIDLSNKGAENTFDFFASSPLKKSTSQGGQPSTEPLAQIGSKNQTIAIDYLDGLSLNSGINFNTMAVGNNISGSKPNAKNFSSGSGLNFSQSALYVKKYPEKIFSLDPSSFSLQNDSFPKTDLNNGMPYSLNAPMTLDPTVPSAQININDYNTMQQMFNTSMGMQQFNYSVHPPVMTNVTPVTNPYQINTTFNSPVINYRTGSNLFNLSNELSTGNNLFELSVPNTTYSNGQFTLI